MVVDNAKALTKGEFWTKLHQADCHIRVTEPYFPWMQVAEGCTWELERGVCQQPKVLWDHCLELQALIHSHTVHNHILTNGQVPETVMTGETADIVAICEFAWYDWVMFCNPTPAFPENKITLGRYLGPATDFGTAITTEPFAT